MPNPTHNTLDKFINKLRAHEIRHTHYDYPIETDTWHLHFSTGVYVALSSKKSDTISIDGFSSADRNRGYASTVLRELCDAADQLHVTLTLVAQAYKFEPGMLDDCALSEWYRRHGFEGRAFLTREPRFVANTFHL